MRLREAHGSDAPGLIDLFRGTVHAVNRRDYSAAQIAAWAPAEIDLAVWAARQAVYDTLVAEEDGEIARFAELAPEGHLHMLFVHKDHQGKGVASMLLAEMERRALAKGEARMTTDASLTAQPFFSRRGFRRIREQVAERDGQELKNYRMEKTLSPHEPDGQ